MSAMLLECFPAGMECAPGELDESGDGGGGSHVVEQNRFARVQLLDFVVSAPLQCGGSVGGDLRSRIKWVLVAINSEGFVVRVRGG